MSFNEQRQAEWAARIKDYRSSDLTMKAWCDANQCTKDQLKYWLYKRKDAAASDGSAAPTRFLPVAVAEAAPTPTDGSSLVIHVGSARIQLQAGFDPQLLRDVVQALNPSC